MARAGDPQVAAASGSALVHSMAHVPGWTERNFQASGCTTAPGDAAASGGSEAHAAVRLAAAAGATAGTGWGGCDARVYERVRVVAGFRWR